LIRQEALIVLNKNDVQLLLPSDRASELQSFGRKMIEVSALTGAGMDALIAEISRRADQLRGDSGSDLVAINARHAQALASAQESLREAGKKLECDGPVELLASDLRTALAAYGEITGKVDNERMLDQLFATFCIGK